MYYLKSSIYAMLALLVLFSACSEDDEEIRPGSAPIADAGVDLQAPVNSSVTLDGNGSSDPDGDMSSYGWALTVSPDGSNASISNGNQAIATFVPDLVGTYVATLTVRDSADRVATDEITITAAEAAGEPPVASIVNEGGRAISEDNENNAGAVSRPFALDGSNTSDPDTESDDLTFTWEIVEAPEESSTASVTATDDNPDEAIFTPDVIGEYTIRLTVTDPGGNSSTAEVEVTINASPEIVDSSIDAPTVWTNIFDDPDLPDYYVVADISITEQLTIDPGVKVIFEPNRGLSISGNSGALVAIGTADSLIELTAEDTENGWDGIIFFNRNAQNEISYATVSYGGQLDFGFGVESANIGVEAQGGVTISNATVSNSFNYGIFIENGGLLREFGDNTLANNMNNPIAMAISEVGSLDENSVYTDNADNTVEVFASTLNQDETLTIPALSNGTAYFVSGRLDVDTGLEIMPGTAMEFDTDAFVEVSGDGYFTAEGIAADSIILVARDQADGWGGISFFTANSRNSFAYARISYGGNRDFGFGIRSANIGVERGGEIKIKNSVVVNSVGDYGLYVEDGGSVNEFSQNRFAGNDGFPVGLAINIAGVLDAAATFAGNGDNSVEIFSSTLPQNSDPQTLSAFADGTPYYVSGRLDIDQDLEIKPGATLEFNKDVRIEVSGTEGSLEVVGTADSLITLTARDLSDGWLGIVYFTNTTANRLEYVQVSYGGRGDFGFGVQAANVGVERNGKVAVANSSFANSFGYGIFVENLGELTDAAGTAITTTQGAVDAGNTFTNNTLGETNL